MPNNAKQKRILILSLCRQGGGFEHYARAIIERLTLPYTLIQSRYANPQCKRDEAKFIPTYQGKISFVLNSLFLLPVLFARFFFMARHYDVLFLPHFHFWNLAFILAFRLRGKSVVLVEHDGRVHIGDEKLQQPLINACLKYATHIIFLTHYVKSLIAPHLLEGKEVAVIPHGIFDFEGLTRAPKAFCPKPTLLFFGRVSKYKGIELLLDSMAQVPLRLFDKLIIAGKSLYRYSTAHLPKELQAKLEIRDEFLSQEEVVELFNRAQILIMPYIEATQSGVAALALANAMPTICTKVGGLGEQFVLDSHLAGGGSSMKPALYSVSQLSLASLNLSCALLQILRCMKPLAAMPARALRS